MGRAKVKVTVDTNILVRAVVRDNIKQAEAAARLLQGAELIAVPLPCLCEFVWVLRQVYGFRLPDIERAMVALLASRNVVVQRAAVDAGMAVLHAGGDFADGLIAFEGSWLGSEVFLSFDKKAVALVKQQGQPAKLLT